MGKHKDSGQYLTKAKSESRLKDVSRIRKILGVEKLHGHFLSLCGDQTTDVVEIVNPDGTTSYFDPETGSRDIKIQFVRTHRGFLGNLLRVETMPDPGWGEAGKTGGTSVVVPAITRGN